MKKIEKYIERHYSYLDVKEKNNIINVFEDVEVKRGIKKLDLKLLIFFTIFFTLLVILILTFGFIIFAYKNNLIDEFALVGFLFIISMFLPIIYYLRYSLLSNIINKSKIDELILNKIDKKFSYSIEDKYFDEELNNIAGIGIICDFDNIIKPIINNTFYKTTQNGAIIRGGIVETYYELKSRNKSYGSLLNRLNFKKIQLSELDFTDHIKIIDNNQLNYQINNKTIKLGILFICIILTVYVCIKDPYYIDILIIPISLFLGYVGKNYFYLSYLNKTNKKDKYKIGNKTFNLYSEKNLTTLELEFVNKIINQLNDFVLKYKKKKFNYKCQICNILLSDVNKDIERHYEFDLYKDCLYIQENYLHPKKKEIFKYNILNYYKIFYQYIDYYVEIVNIESLIIGLKQIILENLKENNNNLD